jgi:hypothetical protein
LSVSVVRRLHEEALVKPSRASVVLARYEGSVLERRLREGGATARRVNALKG